MSNEEYYQSVYVRDDNVPGYVYLMEAEGFHGAFSGLCKRIKIGLSRNPDAREDTLNSNQPPCNINIVDTVYVYKMLEVETYLHNKFKHRNVKLRKSREWFDFDYLSYQGLRTEFTKIKKNPRLCPGAKRFFISFEMNTFTALLIVVLMFGASYIVTSLMASQNTHNTIRSK
ncbi:hypothetical protein CAL7716_057230 [Calothrix sp. PCC 7716]|nr:hypothetical protein CAL7716_057230 [Calothrix sp. PCC 7716]